MTIQNQTQLQNALDRQAWKGGYVEIDPDAVPILIDRPVTVREVTIIGQHKTPQCYVNKPTFEIAAGLQKSPFSFRGAGGGFVGCSFKHLGQTNPQAVKAYPPTILVEEHEHSNLITIRDCTFVNSWHMIDIRHGRFNLEHIYGQVLDVGISIRNSADVGRINNLHLWPFWSIDAPRYPPDGNTRGLVLYNVDWPQMTNIFIFGCHVAIQMHGGNGLIAADPQIVNLSVDACTVGIDLYGTGYGGLQVANYRGAWNRGHGATVPMYGILSRADSDIKGAVEVVNMHLHGEISTQVLWPNEPKLLKLVSEYYNNRG